MNPRARTTAGTVEGTEERGLAVFRGIPFAKAPFGALRFRSPEPAEHWEGARPAQAFGPPPPQTERLLGAGTPATSDPAPDCLTVNVWSPDLGAGLPVMVWIYGGAYLVGSADQPLFDGANLARRGVVVVTLNYRVGMEGFGSLEGAPDNRGVLDQLEALRWVQDNVAAFGGDPGNVTVFGESAGASSIAALLAMPSARGLMRRAILQSIPGTYFTPRLGRDVTERIASELGLGPTASELAARTPAELTRATAHFQAKMGALVERWGRVACTITPFSPIVDGDSLPSAPWEALASGAAKDVEIVAGFMRDEYRVFHVLDGTLEHAGDEDAARMVGILGPGEVRGPDVPGGDGDAVSAYRSAYPDRSPGELIEVAFSDWLFRMSTLRMAQSHVAGGGRAFFYEVGLPSPAHGGAFGACHGFDVPLTFGNFSGLIGDFSGLLLGDDPPPPAVLACSEAIQAAWTAFAAHGDPGWEAFDPRRGNARVFGEEVADTDEVEQRSAAIWERHRFAEMDLLGG